MAWLTLNWTSGWTRQHCKSVLTLKILSQMSWMLYYCMSICLCVDSRASTAHKALFRQSICAEVSKLVTTGFDWKGLWGQTPITLRFKLLVIDIGAITCKGIVQYHLLSFLEWDDKIKTTHVCVCLYRAGVRWWLNNKINPQPPKICGTFSP